MAQTWETVRIFISSTFRDMQAERDHLVRFVFPRLREQLLKRRIHLVDVDLRWGVTSEQDALEVCREIIDECRWFLCMLGGRHGWTPPGQEQSITAAEIHYAALDRAKGKRHCLFYFRAPQVTDSIPEEMARAGGYREFASQGEIEKRGLEQAEQLAWERAEKLAGLKEAITKAGFEPFVYPGRWDAEQQRIVGLEAFGERVYADLLASIDEEFGIGSPGEFEEFAEENTAMEAFIENRVKHYVVGSRRAILEQMTAFAQATGQPNPLLVTGEPGSGKSALLGKFYLDYAKDHPDEIVIPHFIGASRNSTEIRPTLRRLCHELGARAGLRDPIPMEIKELRQVFPAVLRRAAASHRIIILIDALNQLDARDNAHSLRWLPEEFPENVRVIISSLEHPALEAVRRRWTGFTEVTCRPLELGDAEAIVDKFLTRYRKRFDEEQQNALLAKYDAHSPLYLLVALEELRTLGTYEEITTRVRRLPDTVMALFDWILRRLEQGVEGQEAFGEALVSAYTSYIAIGRGGMTEDELEALCHPFDEEQEFHFLQRMLRPYLVLRGELADYFHGQLQEAVHARYLDDQANQRRHEEVAQHFQQRGCDYPRTLSELAYHRYQSALVSGDCQYLFELVDDAVFRKRQFEFFGQPEPVVEEIGYAVDLAVRHCNPVPLIDYAMMRIDVAAEMFRTNLYRLTTIAKDHPQRARQVVALIPYQTLRRTALLLLAWLLCDDEGEREFVHNLVADAASISIPPTVNQVPVLLEVIRKLYRAGFDEVKELVGVIPDCPVRRIYQAAWGNGPDHTRALAVEMTETAYHVPEAPAEEIREFGKTQEFARKLDRQLRRRMGPEAFEEQIIGLLGPSKAADVYFFLASDWIHTGHPDTAAILINRGIYISCSLPLPAIRTLAALVELFGRAGNRDLAEEHAERVRTVARTMERKARADYKSGRFQDALSDLRIALDNLTQVWRPSGAAALLEQSLAGQRPPGAEEEPDTLTRLANARQLLASGRARPVPELLRDILRGLEPDEGGAQLEAILISIYVMARACRDEALAADCAAELQEHGLHPGALYLPGDRNRHALAVLEATVGSDPRCVASLSLCLRIEGLDDRLLEFAQLASNAGSGVEILDAILSQVVRVPGIEPVDLRRASEEVVGTTVKSLDIPSGLGWYYYPGIMLWAAWAGIVFAAIGLRAVLTIPNLLIAGMTFAVAGLIGGSLDLVIWHFIDLWERPEVSRRLLLPELASLASPWLVLLLLRPWLEAMDRTSMGVGMFVAFVLSSLPGIITWRQGLLFTPLSTRVITLGTAISLMVAGILGTLLPALVGNLVSPPAFGGVFLAGMLEIAVCLSIIPKRVAVLSHYRARVGVHKSICS